MTNMFNEDGTYNKTEWKAGDRITAAKLNKIELSLEAINNNDIDRHVEADNRLDILEERIVNDNERMDALEDTIKDNKDAADLAVYGINSRMTFWEDDMNDRIATVEANMQTQINQSKIEMTAMVAEVEADMEGLHTKIEVSVTDFGAKGDGVTDDTEAFRKANAYIWNLAYSINTPNTVSDRGIKLIIPNGVYKVCGDRVLGSIRDEEAYPDYKSVYYTIEGNNSTLLWNIQNEEDRLFYFDYTVNAPNVTNLCIFTIKEDTSSGTTTNGIIFSIEAVKNTGGNWMASAGSGYYANIRTCSGRNSSFIGNRCKYIFRVIGENNSDQSLVTNCSFTYFKTAFYCENSQAVNWTFIRNGFHGAYIDTVYFKFTRMNDNFNIHMNSFSLHDGQTVLECISDVDTNGRLTGRPDYNFSFVDNRMELYHSGEYDYINICKMNFGRMYMARSNFNLASGAGNVRQQFLISGHGSYILDTCDLVKPLFTISGVTDTTAGIGNSDYMGATIRDCMYTQSYDIKLCDDNFDTEDIVPHLLNEHAHLRVMRVSNLRTVNSITSTDFIISATSRYLSQANQKEWSFYATKGSISMGYYINLPPFSTITKIELTNMPTVPPGYNTIRVYFGDKSNNKYIDVENIIPNEVTKTKLTLFDGFASIVDENISNQKIFVCVMNGSEEVVIGGSVKITVMPLNVGSLNNIGAGIHIKENNTDKSIFVGKTSNRPKNPYVGQLWFDTSLGKPTWFNGSNWIDSTGKIV